MCCSPVCQTFERQRKKFSPAYSARLVFASIAPVNINNLSDSMHYDVLRPIFESASLPPLQPATFQFGTHQTVRNRRDSNPCDSSLDQTGGIVGDERSRDADGNRLASIAKTPDRMRGEPRKPDAVVIGNVGRMRGRAARRQIVGRSTQQATGRRQFASIQAAVGETTARCYDDRGRNAG